MSAFIPNGAVVVFNQKIREAEPGVKGKLAGVVKAGVLVEVGGRFVTVSNKMLDRISVCTARSWPLATSRPSASESQPEAGCRWAGHQRRTGNREVGSGGRRD